MAKYRAAGQEATFTVKVKQVKENSTYKIEICQAGGGTSSVLKTLTGTWTTSSSEQGGVPIEIDGSTATIRWTAEGPPADGDQRGWRTFAVVTVTDDKGKEKKQSSQELEVYNDFVEVESVRDDGSAIKEAGFRLLVNKKLHVKEKTGADGKVKLTEVPGGQVKIEWERPYSLDKWVTQKGTAVKAQLSVAKKASIVSPKGTKKKPHKQYVNLPADPVVPQNGTKVTVKVKLEGGVAGDKVYVRQSPSPKNSKRNDVVLGLSGASTTAWAAEGGIEVTLAGDAPEASFDVEMGKAGGDLLILEVGGTNQCKDASVALQNWRKLYYQISAPDGTEPPAMNRLVKCMADAFVEYEEVKAKRQKVKQADAGMPAGSWFDAKHLGGPAGTKYLNVGSSNRDWFHTTYFKGTKAPHECHVLYAHTQMDPKADETKDVTIDDTGRELLVWPATGGIVDGVSIQYSRNVFPVDLTTGTTAFKSGTWAEVGGARNGALAAADINFTYPKYSKYIEVKLPAAALTVLGEAGKQIKLTVKVATMAGTYLGEAKAGTGKQLIATHAGDKGGRTHITTINDVMAHELGHTLGQAVTSGGEPPGLAHADHKRQYTGMDHQGSHCADGMKDADFGDGAGSGLASFAGMGKKCRCIMYGENDQNGSNSTGKFCARCRPYLMAQTMESIA